MNNTIAIIADDHTGAADSAIPFAKAGGRTSLLLDHAELDTRLADLDAVALSTESRFLQPDKAAAKVTDIVARCRKSGVDRFFKKVDSTMRGNPGSEVMAALQATGCRAALICTAMPEAGRTCRDGVILLDGAPLHTTHFGHDPFHPLSTSTISQLLGRQCDLSADSLSLDDLRGPAEGLAARVHRLLDQGCALLIADAEDSTDLQRLGDILHSMPQLLPVGAAGLARALAKKSFARSAQNTQPEATQKRQAPHGRMLAIVGSLTGVSRNQADVACAEGRFVPLELEPDAACADPQEEFARLQREACAANGANLLLQTKALTEAQQKSGADGQRVAGLLGQAARTIFRNCPCEIIFSTGGNTSMAVAKAMGITSVTLWEELLPGVVLGSCQVPDHGQCWFITKAGGFGSSSLLLDLAARFAYSHATKEG
jgi:uncharacterized protein YgbK (DUF1537 family)